MLLYYGKTPNGSYIASTERSKIKKCSELQEIDFPEVNKKVYMLKNFSNGETFYSSPYYSVTSLKKGAEWRGIIKFKGKENIEESDFALKSKNDDFRAEIINIKVI